MSILYKIQKKDGALEDYDRNKIVGGIVKAGGTQEEAEKVADSLEAWFPQIAKENIVSSLDLRVKGLEILKTVNSDVAALFESYKKPEA